MDNIKEWTSLPMPEPLTRASCRKDWKRIFTVSSLMSLRRSHRSRDLTEPKVVGWNCNPLNELKYKKTKKERRRKDQKKSNQQVLYCKNAHLKDHSAVGRRCPVNL